MHGHHLTHVNDPGPARLGGLGVAFLALAILGLLAFLGLGYFTSGAEGVQNAWMGFTVAYVFFFFLSMGAASFLAINYVVGAKWYIVIRRPLEAVASFAYTGGFVLPILGAVLATGHLYSWAQPGADYPYPGTLKAIYLTPGLHMVKVTIYSVVLAALTYLLVRNSTQADRVRTPELQAKQLKLSIIFLIFFGPVFSLFGVDVIKSLEPRWFSTMWGVYCFAGALVSALALTMLISFWLRRRTPLLHERQMYDLGTYVMGFSTFMMYIGFSQFMLIWYANLPDETFYFLSRYEGGWSVLTVSLPVLKWIVPFLILMPPTWRTSVLAQSVACASILLGQLADVWWMIAPVFPLEGARVAYGPSLVNVAAFVGVMGLFGWSLISFLNRHSILPVGDPNLVNSVNGEYLHA